jgi:N-acetylneuraminic acid mutarotase
VGRDKEDEMKSVYKIISFMIMVSLILPYAILAEEGKWMKKANMPIAVVNHSLSSVNDKIYVIGGTNQGFNLNLIPFSSVYEYEPKTDIWVRKADTLTPRGYFRSSVVDGKIYAIGGWTDGGFSNAVEAYDPVADKWEKKADIPTARAEAVTEQVNGKIYVIGGHNQHSGSCLSIVEEYNPKTNTWTKKNDMPIARSFATSCVINDKIYIFGGTSLLVANFHLPVEIYNPATDTWSKGSDIPTPRGLLGSCVINGMVYAMGGFDKNFVTTSILEIYDPINDNWMKGQNMPIRLEGNAKLPMVNGKSYSIGGSDAIGTILSDVWEYTPEYSQSSSVTPKGKFTIAWGEIRSVK